jgi:hypothetical protein
VSTTTQRGATVRLILLFATVGLLPSAFSIPVVMLFVGGVDALADPRIAVGMLGISAMQLIPCTLAGVAAAFISSRVRLDMWWIGASGALGFLTSTAFLFVTPLYASFFQDRPITVLVTGILGATGTSLAAAFGRKLRRLPRSPDR